MADHLREKLKAAGIKGISIEGLENCDWVLIDSGDVIVHLFDRKSGIFTISKSFGRKPCRNRWT